MNMREELAVCIPGRTDDLGVSQTCLAAIIETGQYWQTIGTGRVSETTRAPIFSVPAKYAMVVGISPIPSSRFDDRRRFACHIELLADRRIRAGDDHTGYRRTLQIAASTNIVRTCGLNPASVCAESTP